MKKLDRKLIVVLCVILVTIIGFLIGFLIWFLTTKKEHYDYMSVIVPSDIPIVVISWNSLTFVRNFIDQLKKFPNPIIILDNNSHYPPLLEYYDFIEKELGSKINVILLPENYGHLVYLKRHDLLPKIYILSDPDLQLNPKTPHDMASILLQLSHKYNAWKVGLALDISDSHNFEYLPNYGNITNHLGGDTSQKHNSMTIEKWESQFWKNPIKDDDYELYDADVDTTFCLVNLYERRKRAIRIAGNFMCKHLPWYKNFMEDNIPLEELKALRKNNKSSTTIISKQKKITNQQKINDMLKYAIYFPQFHEIPENNINFYKGYTDVINLRDINITYKETPSNIDLPIISLTDYDLKKNTKLIQSQVDLLKKYNIDGFATYHYWFSDNSITKEKMIMEKINKKLLSSDLGDKRIFYIWANEDWTGNHHLGESKEIISNSYSTTDCKEHCNYLINVFLEPGYLKIENKPVFFIHHPWKMNGNLPKFRTMLDDKCKSKGFDGVFFSESSHGTDKKTVQTGGTSYYDHHPHYKKKDSWAVKIPNSPFNFDYARYVENIELNADIQTIFFDFDNRTRLHKGKHLRKSTVCYNNNEREFIRYMKKIREKTPKMLLINAWNEWGEKMHIEPSNEKGTYYLDLINKYLSI